MSIRDQILNADDKEIKEFSLPRVGKIYLRTITGKERDDFEKSMYEMRGKDIKFKDKALDNLKARFLVLCICEKDGTRAFSDAREDIESIGSLSARTVDFLFTEAQKMNALSEDDVQELLGNSEAAPQEDSNSDLP